MNSKIINFLFLFFCCHSVLVSCQNSSEINMSEQEKIKNRIILKTGNELQKEKQLTLAGLGGSSIKGYEHVAVSFDYYRPLNIAQARKLIIFATELLLNNLNISQDLKIQYSIENIKLHIFVITSKNSKVTENNICIVDFINGKITYFKNDQNLSKIYQETYNEALKIIETKK